MKLLTLFLLIFLYSGVASAEDCMELEKGYDNGFNHQPIVSDYYTCLIKNESEKQTTLLRQIKMKLEQIAQAIEKK